jgi:hypothetical protein
MMPAAAAVAVATLGGAPSSKSFQEIAHPPAMARPMPGAVSARVSSATSLGR